MRKISCLLLALVLICGLAVSCSSVSVSYDKTEMLPQFDVSLNDLDKDQYEFIGNVTGSSNFTVSGDKSEYYTLAGVLDVDNIDSIVRNSTMKAALNKALYEMTLKAKEMNANILILPSYSVESKVVRVKKFFSSSVSTEVTVSVSAVAIKLVNSDGQSLKVY